MTQRGGNQRREGTTTHTHREQLIADWRHRLAEAEDVEPEHVSRPAWMTRLRMRLYRFLISLYGEGEWNAGESAGQSTQSSRAEMMVADESLPLAGKPAKDESSIRAALQSFAAGGGEKPAAGPLLEGTQRSGWVVVASTNWGLDPQRSSDALTNKGIASRTVGHADDITVEVLAVHQASAMKLIGSQLSRLALRRNIRYSILPSVQRQLAEKIALARGYLLLGLAMAPLLGVAAVGIVDYFDLTGLDIPTPTTCFALFIVAWLSSSALMCLAYLQFGMGLVEKELQRIRAKEAARRGSSEVENGSRAQNTLQRRTTGKLTHPARRCDGELPGS